MKRQLGVTAGMNHAVAAALVLATLMFALVAADRATAQAVDTETIPAEAIEIAVVNVVDGNTFVADLQGSATTIRLAGTALPEGDCLQERANTRLRQLLPALKQAFVVTGNTDVVADGAVMRYVWILRGDKPTLLNEKMIKDGYVGFDAATANDDQFQAALETGQQRAQDNFSGMWDDSACDPAAEVAAAAPTETPVPTEIPPPIAADPKASYTPLADVRELAIRAELMVGDQLYFIGRIFTIQVDSEGAGIQVWVAAPDGTEEPVVVFFEGDTTGMYEGTYVQIWGTVVGTFEGENLMGGAISQPLVYAEFLEFA